jgi:hypothetical protein
MNDGQNKRGTHHQRGGTAEPSPMSHKTLDDKLEQGLEESFPGSDPVAITQPPPSSRDKRK